MKRGKALARILSGLAALTMLLPTLAVAAPDGSADAASQPTGSTAQATTPKTTDKTEAGTSSVPNDATQLPAQAVPAPTAETKPESQTAPVQMTGTPRSDSSIKDMLETDDAKVTKLYQTDRQTGTTPFDGDDAPGDDSGPGNDIVRSYDTVTYTYSFNVAARDSSHYYRSARIGFRFELPQPAEAMTFDMEQMGWVDYSPGYQPQITTESIGGTPTQVLTAYRLLNSSASLPTVIPGSSSVSLTIKVKGARNGTTFSPGVQAWAAPNPSTRTDPAHYSPDPVRVSAKLNLNLRITDGVNEHSAERLFDFDTAGAHTYVNHELGRVKGVISKFNWAVDMRWPDRSKGLKGLEAPSGPITFSLSASDLWQRSNGQAFPAERKLQPYLWDFGTIDGDFNNAGRRPQDQGWNPRFDNYDYARSTNGQAGRDRVTDNGSYTVSQSRRTDRTIFTLTLSNYQVGDSFPILGHTYSPSTSCTPALASSDCTRTEVGEISTGYLYIFNPTTIDGAQVADHYGESGLSMQSKVRDGGLAARSVTGQDLASTSDPEDTSNQAMRNDDEWNSAIYTQGSGTGPGISNIIQYSCLNAPNYFDDGVDCGWWGASDNLGGTDSALTGTQVRIMAGFNFRTSKADLPLLGMTLVKIDPSVIDLPEAGDLDLPWSGNGIWQNASNDATGDPDHNLTVVRYATKPDGSTWTSDAEQNRSDIGDLRYYDSKAQAQAHGTIVAILLGGRTAAPSAFADKDSRYGFGGFKVTVRPEARFGSVAQLTSTAHVYTRQQLAALSGLDPTRSSDQEWEDWARTQDPTSLRASTDPSLSTPRTTYQKARYDTTTGYLGGDSGGNQLGDSLYVAGEQPGISKSVEQTVGANTPKTNFDLDVGQRFVDWRLTVHATSNATQDIERDTTDFFIKDTLPAKMTYLPGSARLGGTYREGTPESGQVTGGRACEPVVSTDSLGRTVLSWTLTDAPIDGTRLVIHYGAFIGNPSDPNRDVSNGQNLETTATVMSRRNMARPNTFTGTVSQASIRVSRYYITSLFTSTPQLINEVGAPIRFTNMLGNFSSTPTNRTWAVDVLPHRGGNENRSSFHGTYALQDLTVKTTGPTDLSDISIHYTTDPKWQVEDPGSIGPSVFTTWPQAGVDQTTGRVTIPSDVVAWAFVVNRQPVNSRYDFTFALQPRGGMPADAYQNRWGNDANQVPASALVAKRAVSGLVWYDENGDGIRAASDTLLKGVRVSLLDERDQPVMSTIDTGRPVTALTDARGSYTLTGVPAGRFHLLFQQAQGSDWSGLRTTRQEAPGASRTENSTARALDDGGRMTGAVIPLDDFPQAADMATVTHTADYNNCGLTGPLATNTAEITLKKNLTGRDWTDQESYTLLIEPLDGAPASALPGTVTLDALHRQSRVPVDPSALPADGTYHYRIREKAGHQPGVTYDARTTSLTIRVTSHPDQLRRTVATTLTNEAGRSVGEAVFTNTYAPQAATIAPQVRKNLQGRAIKEGEFRFKLIDKGTGRVVSQARNAADGRVTFAPQALDAVGTRHYLVQEVPGGDRTITYDRTRQELDIRVTDNPPEGRLVAEQVGDEPTFRNIYNPTGPLKPVKPGKPATPDPTTQTQAGDSPATGKSPGKDDQGLSATGAVTTPLLVLVMILTASGAVTLVWSGTSSHSGEWRRHRRHHR